MDTDRTSAPGESAEGYVDIYLLPVPEAKLDDYRRQASAFGAVVREYGALSYREFLSDDGGEQLKLEPLRDGERLTAAVAGFRTRAHRDEVMDGVMKDPRVTELVDGEPLADMTQMHYGGFHTFVAS